MTYIVKRNLRQRNLRMHFSDKGELIVSCPYFVSKEQLQTFVESNKDWIEKQLSKQVLRTYTTGETFPFWGQLYTLKVNKSTRNKVQIQDDSLLVFVTNPEDPSKVKKQLYNFYKTSLLNYVSQRILYWQTVMGFKMPDIRISNAKTTWGVCYSKNNLIKFSAMTAVLEEDLIDMIVVHELCHLKYHNHSQQFWSEVGKYVPDLDKKKTRLRQVSKSGLNRNLF